ncbi:MAG TPA: hypothetical protein VKR59_06110 [Terriglobales bacterium]|nr:hypothetical protein [Terriglobales bacterium]
MQRCSSVFLSIATIASVLALAGCLGKSSPNPGGGGVQSVTLSPSNFISIETGATQVFSASARNATGGTILGLDIQFIVQSGDTNPAPLSVASNGNACAGTWDITVTICTAGTPGIAIVTATTNGFRSAPTTVYVHQHIDSVQISSADATPPLYDCFSQGQAALFQAKAYSNNTEITDTVGPFNWSSSNNGVVTINTAASSLLPNQIQTTAKSPGITQLSATVSGATSQPFPFTTCLISAVYLQINGQPQAGNSVIVNNGGSVIVTATAVDTLFGVAPGDNAPLANPPLTWSTTNPEVIAFGTLTNTTGTNTAAARANLGGATLTASCSPPSCNIGLPGLTPTSPPQTVPGLPIYASNGTLPNGSAGFGSISVQVAASANTKPPTYTAWATTGITPANPNGGCNDAPGCVTALFSVSPTNPGTNPIGNIVGLPRTPNSMLVNHSTTPRIYFGSDQGLMYVDVSSASPSATLISGSSTPCNVALCGKALAVSNNGSLVAVADNTTIPHQVYIFNGGSNATAPVDLVIPNDTVTAAAFSPDQLKLFLLTDTGHMYIYSTVDALTSVPLATTATDVKFSADGSFAYIAGAPASSVSSYSTCSEPGVGSVEIPNGTVTTSSTPVEIFPSSVLPLPFEHAGPPPFVTDNFFWTTQTILALEPPNIEFLKAEWAQIPLPPTPLLPQFSQYTCDPITAASPGAMPMFLGFTRGNSYNLGLGAFTPVYAQLVDAGNEMIVVGRHIPAVLLFNVSDGTTSSITLTGTTPDPLAASASTDGSQVYVAVCDAYPNNDPSQPCAAASVHIVITNSQTQFPQGDYLDVPYINVNDNNNMNMCNNQGPNGALCLPNMIAIRPQ